MPTFAEIAGLLGQYFRDAAPGGELNREVQPQVVGDVARGGLLGLTADTLGTPVDLAAMAMRPLGYSHPKPVGGSDWLADKLTTPSGSGAETAARTVTGLLTPSPADVAHLVPGLLGATVWHGSPHKFDKFDISKIGTGEGAQAYGHGLYMADAKETAKTYAGMSKPNPKDVDISLLEAAKDFIKNGMNPMDGLKKSYKSATTKEIEDAVLMARGGYKPSLYKVDLPDEHIAKMLDWDKPLSQQPKQVQDALKRTGVYDPNITGKDVVYPDKSHFGPDGAARNRATSEWLKSIGIPGIKYLDGGSRTAGEGTRNYVVFDDSLLKILERQ